jgi:hypothetical protein
MQQKYLTTGQMSEYLGLSKDFLLKHKGNLFIKGKHFFCQRGLNKLLWDKEVMERWVREKKLYENPFEEILNELC